MRVAECIAGTRDRSLVWMRIFTQVQKDPLWWKCDEMGMSNSPSSLGIARIELRGMDMW